MSKIKISIIGAGHWGPHLIRNFQMNPKSVVVGIADKSESRLSQLKSKYPSIYHDTNPYNVITNTEADAIVICSPTSTHFELAQFALENGKHVFVEKPLATTAEECERLVELAESKHLTLFVGHVFVYNAGIQLAQKIIQDGGLGDLHYIQMTRTNLGPIREDVSALWDLAPHDLSILEYWLGSLPNRVSAVGGRLLNDTLEDCVFATYRFANKILANIHVSWLNPKKVREVVVVGSKKMLLWDDMDLVHPIKIFDKRVSSDSSDLVDTLVKFRASIYEGDTILPRVKANEPLSFECDSFLEAVINPDFVSISSGRHGANVVRGLLAAEQSMKNNGLEVSITYDGYEVDPILPNNKREKTDDIHSISRS